jgi:predicted enzyme related to lactoylglutathione lyase
VVRIVARKPQRPQSKATGPARNQRALQSRHDRGDGSSSFRDLPTGPRAWPDTGLAVSANQNLVINLPEAVRWFGDKVHITLSFSDARMAVLVFGPFTLILDASTTDSIATIGFNSADCDVDFAAMVARGANVLEPPRDRPYGARVAYLKGPGALTIELEQLLHQVSARESQVEEHR